MSEQAEAVTVMASFINLPEDCPPRVFLDPNGAHRTVYLPPSPQEGRALTIVNVGRRQWLHVMVGEDRDEWVYTVAPLAALHLVRSGGEWRFGEQAGAAL